MKKSYLKHHKHLTPHARTLRSHATDAELRLWFYIRRKQILNVQFYRQKPIGRFIVDFYAPKAKLIIELDGSQHFEEEHFIKDKKRDEYLSQLQLKVLRFDNGQIMHSLDGVLEEIYRYLRETANPPGEDAGPLS